jgi:ectoine hydroxylase
MDPSCLQYRLTEAEREQFNTQGYLVIEEALPHDRVADLIRATDALFERTVCKGHAPTKTLFFPNFIPEDDAFFHLVDYERILPKVWGILGWNIYLYHAHLIVTPPSGETPNDKTFGWHQDSGRVNQEIECHPRPRLSLKVAYFLTDVSEPGRGNMWIIPGSHLQDAIDLPADRIGQPSGAMPVCVPPGSAVLFDRRLWHTASPNWSPITRKVLFYGYGYRWLRTKDDMTVQHLWGRSDPIRRQLLGWRVNCNGLFSPSEEDVPLRTWLREHSPEEAR